ncbi:uncharacterized protein LOC120112482 isoform X2 [Phoenix dactylifera]|uniref:Uncharacterized protein LOC120112482 isoform X2 n=1 Tax=Phoenix dactylifera TaxID=42345 RepID=A0A8B9AQY2_PHODC|nr:uncharacterized protein LOC120112482 isoform X2 [Phoenix dactylifera]
MEASSAVFFFSVKPLLPFNLCSSSPSSSSSSSPPRHLLVVNFKPRTIKSLMFPPSSRGSLSLSPPFAVAEALEQVADTSDSPRGASHKIDKNGRFCSPRAARELALKESIVRPNVSPSFSSESSFLGFFGDKQYKSIGIYPICLVIHRISLQQEFWSSAFFTLQWQK